jgi:uncharacterized membrane protein
MAVLRTSAHRHLILLLIPVTIAVATAALGSAVGMPELPEPLALLDRRLPGIFRLHMLASALALILLPWIILLRSRPRMHRALGRLGAVLLLVGAAASLPAAIQSEAVPLARLGFLAQGLLCLALLATAIRAIRVGNTSLHARLMLQMSATIFGAVLLRWRLPRARDCHLTQPTEPSRGFRGCCRSPLCQPGRGSGDLVGPARGTRAQLTRQLRRWQPLRHEVQPGMREQLRPGAQGKG